MNGESKAMKRLTLLLAGAILLVTGCDKVGLFSNVGKTIVFQSKSNVNATRTVYETNYTGTIQPINWVAGDVIRVYSPEAQCANDNHWADYIVTPITTDLTKGTLSNANGNGLLAAAGEQNFFSIYPAPSSSAEAVVADGVAGKFSLTIPQAQLPGAEMEYAYMLASATANAGTNPITLYFNPAFTAFEFQVKAEADTKLVSVELMSESVPAATTPSLVTGTATAQYDATVSSTNPAVDKYKYTAGTGNNSAKVTFPANTILTTGTDYTFTVFALPVDQTGMTVSFTVAEPDGNQNRTFKLALKYTNGEYLLFDACKKHRIKGLVAPRFSKIIEINSMQVIDWNDAGSQEVDVH